jgi:hypothetical protein
MADYGFFPLKKLTSAFLESAVYINSHNLFTVKKFMVFEKVICIEISSDRPKHLPLWDEILTT